MLLPTDSTPYLESLFRLAQPIDGAGDSIERLAELIRGKPTVLDDPRTLRKAFSEELRAKQLHWPWLEHWRAEFSRLQVWPRMWGGPEPDIALLLHHSMCFALRHDFSRGFVRFSAPLTDEPEAIQALIWQRIAAYLAGDAGAGLPPYFPGDRTMARPSMPPLERRQPDKLTCPFLGYGKHY